MAAAAGVPEPISGPNIGNDDFGTGFGTGGRGQGGQCRSVHLGIRNTNVFETGFGWEWQEDEFGKMEPITGNRLPEWPFRKLTTAQDAVSGQSVKSPDPER
jgi:hypothetical protein